MIFEVSSSGHRLGYVRMLLEALAGRRLNTSVVFVLGHDFRGQLEDDLVTSAQRLNDVRLVFMDLKETRLCQRPWGITRRLNTHRVFESYLDVTDSDLGFVNYLDTILAGLAFRLFSRSDAAVAGILFRPTVHYPSLGVLATHGVTPATPLKEWLVRKLDDLVYRRALRNPRLKVVLTLDPLFPEFAPERYPQGDKVQPLAEPYSAPRVGGDHLDDGRTRFLIFGLLTDRKGLLETLDALLNLSGAELARTSLVVAGRLHEDVRSQVWAKVNTVRRLHPALDIEIRDRFIPDEELVGLVEASDVILAPYRRHVGSSGVLAWAAHFGRPVISQRYGLMGALVVRYRLGMTCDPGNPRELASCMRRVLQEGARDLADPVRMAEYAATNGQSSFVDAIIETIETPPLRAPRQGL